MAAVMAANSSSDSRSVTPFYLDKALWVTLITPVAVILAKKFGIQLNIEEIVALILPTVTYIAGHKWKSGAIAVAEVHADTQAASAANWANQKIANAAVPAPAPAPAGV